MRYEMVIPGWHPVRLNRLVGAHPGTRGRLKKRDAQQVGTALLVFQVPKATGPRRVSLRITLGPRQRADPDCFHKSLLDSLVACGGLVNDSSRWCQLGPVDVCNGPAPETTIILEDLDA